MAREMGVPCRRRGRGRNMTDGESREGDDEEHDCCSVADIGDGSKRGGRSCVRGRRQSRCLGWRKKERGEARRTRHHRDRGSAAPPKQYAKRDESSSALTHWDEEENQHSADVAVGCEDRERTVSVGEPVGDDPAEDGGGVEDGEGVGCEVGGDAVIDSVCECREQVRPGKEGERRRELARCRRQTKEGGDDGQSCI
jgi:hypothetical protein